MILYFVGIADTVHELHYSGLVDELWQETGNTQLLNDTSDRLALHQPNMKDSEHQVTGQAIK